MLPSPNASHVSSTYFDLNFDTNGDDGQQSRPMSAGNDSQRTKRASSTYGVALTSTPSQDERAALPSQQQQQLPQQQKAWRRKSAPGGGLEYEELMKRSSGNLEELFLQRGPGDRTSTVSTAYDDSKRTSQYLEEQFQYKDNAMSQAREKVQKQSPVVAELKTNVIIKDEFTLVTDLSYHLAQRYTRPDSCIMIKVDHSACLALGGNFDPCYFLTINAVPSVVGPTTNKRNAALIQAFMADILSVPASRGIVTFRPVKEENLATNGMTMLGEIERQEKANAANDPNALKSAIKDATRRSMTFPKSNAKLNGDHRSNGNLAVGSTSSPSVTPPPPMKDQPSGNADKDGRPSTAHGGFDGLRMNGISTDQLVGKNSRLPNGRPKTFSGQSTSTSIQDSMKAQPLPHVSHQTAQPRAPLPKRMSASNATTTTTSTKVANGNGAVSTRPAPPRNNSTTSTRTAPPATAKPTKPNLASISLPLERRTQNTYLDNISSLSNQKNPTPALDENDDIPLAKPAAGRANTAKRRSTITATPQLPPSSRAKSSGGERDRDRDRHGALKPPPVPDDTKSMHSKLGKRKSFMRMFKRSSVPAWYEQSDK